MIEHATRQCRRQAWHSSRKVGDLAEARECCSHVVGFLESALAHVPHHPLLSLQRHALADLHDARGEPLEVKFISSRRWFKVFAIVLIFMNSSSICIRIFFFFGTRRPARRVRRAARSRLCVNLFVVVLN